MPARSNSSTFNCKLNKTYKDALKWKKPGVKKPKEPTDAQLRADYTVAPPTWRPVWDHAYREWSRAEWVQRWHLDHDDDDWDDDWDDDYPESNTSCCGIEELDFQGMIGDVRKNNAETRQRVAKHVQAYNNEHKDKRVLIVGLPIRKVGQESSQYEFANYKVLRKILLDFGFKQASPKPYKNANSNNMLSVLVGQMP